MNKSNHLLSRASLLFLSLFFCAPSFSGEVFNPEENSKKFIECYQDKNYSCMKKLEAERESFTTDNLSNRHKEKIKKYKLQQKAFKENKKYLELRGKVRSIHESIKELKNERR
jgi:hypothetical protein